MTSIMITLVLIVLLLIAIGTGLYHIIQAFMDDY